MAVIKVYTNIEQSKKLAEILPLESADGTWKRYAICGDALNMPKEIQYIHIETPFRLYSGIGTPCWSLAALLNVLPNYQMQTQDDGIGILCSCNGKFNIVTADNPVDACYGMIIKLNEQKLL